MLLLLLLLLLIYHDNNNNNNLFGVNFHGPETRDVPSYHTNRLAGVSACCCARAVHYSINTNSTTAVASNVAIRTPSFLPQYQLVP